MSIKKYVKVNGNYVIMDNDDKVYVSNLKTKELNNILKNHTIKRT